MKIKELRTFLREKEMAEVAKMSLKERLYLALELSEFCLALHKNLAKKRI
ncbi:MAG: hypothetical protein HY920_03095 [Elusimicrobia bacterium]|nr:hypothetical protein [Elusimicrobiota bacterium]